MERHPQPQPRLATGVPDARVSVEDDGEGVPPGTEGGGVGLGVVQRLVERIRGSLALRSGPGRTAWVIGLPGAAKP